MSAKNRPRKNWVSSQKQETSLLNEEKAITRAHSNMRSSMSVLDIVSESDAYSRLPIAGCGTWRAPGTRGKVQYGERPPPRHETRALTHLGFPIFVLLRIFPSNEPVAFGQPFLPLTTFSGA
jgi:hypothetical protein